MKPNITPDRLGRSSLGLIAGHPFYHHGIRQTQCLPERIQ